MFVAFEEFTVYLLLALDWLELLVASVGNGFELGVVLSEVWWLGDLGGVYTLGEGLVIGCQGLAVESSVDLVLGIMLKGLESDVGVPSHHDSRLCSYG